MGVSRSESEIQFLCLPEQVIVKARPGQSILQALLDSKIEIDHSCGGNGTCGTCRIFIQQGLEKLKPRNEIESEMAQERGFQSHERLSCQTLAVADTEIRKANKD